MLINAMFRNIISGNAMFRDIMPGNAMFRDIMPGKGMLSLPAYGRIVRPAPVS